MQEEISLEMLYIHRHVRSTSGNASWAAQKICESASAYTLVVEMISELLALFLPEEMQLLYRQKKMWPPPPRHVLLQLVLLS
jgi:hypothetical protein